MSSPKKLLKAWEIKPDKNKGQNFISERFAKHIASLAKIDQKDTVLEIGAGTGVFTVQLAKAASKVYAVEIDPRLIGLLKTELALYKISNVDIINQNILDIDIEKLIDCKAIATGNLPYNISSQIIIKLVNARKIFNKAFVMLQKEMAARIAAKPDTSDYSRLSVIVQYCADVRIAGQIKAEEFFPKPNVDSALLEINFKEKYKVKDETLFFNTVKAAFSKRRKTLRNSLAGALLKIDTSDSARILEKAGIDPRRRAETLEVHEFINITDCIYLDKFN